MVSEVGENWPLIGPAPAAIVFPAAARLAFQRRLKAYWFPGVSVITDWRKAALGENVPAEPPDSFQPTSCGGQPLTLTKMARSWLMPAFAVHRSALAWRITATGSSVVTVRVNLASSSARHAVPALPESRYCCVLEAV